MHLVLFIYMVNRSLFARKQIVFALVFGTILSFFAAGSASIDLDVGISKAIQATPLPILLPLMHMISLPGNWPYFLGLYGGMLGLLIRLKHIRAALFITLTATVFPLFTLLKWIIASNRPSPNDVTVYLKINDYGFPSGHVFFYTVFFGFILYMIRQTKLHSLAARTLESLCIVLITLIGMSRIYLGVHWFTDVIGGYIFGFIVLTFIIAGYEKHR